MNSIIIFSIFKTQRRGRVGINNLQREWALVKIPQDDYGEWTLERQSETMGSSI